ncbi:MAG: DUF1446 domain-containing protein [Burkholderiales bacterium]|nr:DUF1446 domain-containing protein [Burkholderiales bacterium]
MIKIGGASGFWGDSMTGILQLVNEPGMQYITFDYLAELTMSLLATAKAKNPDMGFCPDFVEMAMKFTLPTLKKKGIRVVSNAGGINPMACAKALETLAKGMNIELKIAVVQGDDVLGFFPEAKAQGICDMNTSTALPAKWVSANAYLGAFPIAKALALGADVVITGRTVDSALPLGVLIHEFGWNATDFDRLASGSLAGHLIECGAQATGGLFTDWRTVPDWANIGYPVLECQSDGSFVVTKPANTGGLVSVPVLSEQMLYEVGDPANYILPDVICDFSGVQMQQEGGGSEHRIRVSGAKGKPPTAFYKVCATYVDGYRCVANLSIVGVDALEKARRTGEAILARTQRLFTLLGMPDYTATRIEVMGEEADFGVNANPHLNMRETVVRIAVCHPMKQALEIFAREIAPAGTSFSPGTTGSLSAGRPSVAPKVRLFSFLLPKNQVQVQLRLSDETIELPVAEPANTTAIAEGKLLYLSDYPRSLTPDTHVPLIALAYARSGDKADNSNIGVIARHSEFLPYIAHALTEESLRKHLGHYVKGRIRVFEVAGINAFNVLLEQALDGGGLSSLRSDPLGKGMAQILLTLQVAIPVGLLEKAKVDA